MRILPLTTNAQPRHAARAAFLVLVFCLFSAAAPAATPAAATPAEAKTERAFQAARNSGPLTLRAFLVQMPKGADLHSHLSGAVYAESWIRAAGEDGLCVSTASLSFQKPTAITASLPPKPVCGDAAVAASSVPTSGALYDSLIDSFSMRSFVPSTGISGHDHFFATFARFGGTSHSHAGEWFDEVAARAAAQNEQYMELMETPDFKHTAALGRQLGWNPDLAKFRDALLANGLRDDIPVAREYAQQALARRNALEKCGTADAAPACKVELRLIYQVLRGFPPEQVFAQTLLGFEVASADPTFVGINFVMPEDGYTSMRDYRLQMQMLDYLHSVYPKVHISLHAGELAPGLVTPDGLTFHIRSAVEKGHAERIGHGVDIMYEDRPYQLLKQMAALHVLVEVNLSSNDLILGIRGVEHPLPIYLKYGVPVALSTDDEGVSRIDLTHEFVRAALTYPLTYRDLKKMVRASIEHSFLPGESLWKDGDGFAQPVEPCAAKPLTAVVPAKSCSAFLESSQKARQQWELEQRFRVFETAQ